MLTTTDRQAAAALRRATRDPLNGIGREIPKNELVRFAPHLADALVAFEPAEHFLFGAATDGELFTAPHERGVHGLFPSRRDYLASFILWGQGIRPARLPQTSMLTIAPRLAQVIGVSLQNR